MSQSLPGGAKREKIASARRCYVRTASHLLRGFFITRWGDAAGVAGGLSLKTDNKS